MKDTEILNQYEPLIHKIAYQFKTVAPQLSHEDLVQEGKIGLLLAISTYDPSYNTKFFTWAYYKVLGAITSCRKFNRKVPLSLPVIHEDPEPFYLKDLQIENLLDNYLDTHRSKEIIKYRFGLFDYPELSSKQIAQKFNITRSKVDSVIYKFKKEVRKNCPDLIEYIR